MADVIPPTPPGSGASASAGSHWTGSGAAVAGAGASELERAESWTVGVEEEFLLLDAETRQSAPYAEEVLAAAGAGPGEADGPGGPGRQLSPSRRKTSDTSGTQLKHEFFSSQAEVASAVCTDLVGIAAELFGARRRLAAAARSLGLTLVSSGTPVVDPGRRKVPLTRDERYQRVADIYASAVDDYEVGGCHVHVGMPDRETAVAVVNHLRLWLPSLLALSVNSPFFEGRDTGYGSWRIVAQSRFPSAGVPPYFTSAAHFDEELGRLVDCNVVADARQTFWLARPSERFPTVELRVADAAPSAEDAVFQAALSRALVRTARTELAEGREAAPVSGQVVASALWAAARYGLRGPGVDPLRGCETPAAMLVGRLFDHVTPALEESGDLRYVRGVLDRLLRGEGGAGPGPGAGAGPGAGTWAGKGTWAGTGAERQRSAARAGGLYAAVDLLARQAEQAPGILRETR